MKYFCWSSPVPRWSTGARMLLVSGLMLSVHPALATDTATLAQPCLEAIQRQQPAAACPAAIEALIEMGLADSEGTPPISGQPAGLAALQAALELAQQAGDRAAQGRVLNHLGDLYRQVGRYPQALRQHEQALAIAQSLNDLSLMGAALNGLGRVQAAFGDPSSALADHEQAMAAFLAAGDRPGEAQTWLDWGYALIEADQLTDAQSSFEQGLALYRRLTDPVGTGKALLGLGEVYQTQDDLPLALSTYGSVLDIDAGDYTPVLQQAALTRLGDLYHVQGQYGAAIATYQQALPLSQQRGRLADTATLWHFLGLSYVAQGDVTAAMGAFQQAAAYYEVLGYRGLQGESLSNLAQLVREQGQPELAIALYKQAINVLESVRTDLRVLPLELQSTFPQTFADTYRSLADLLLAENRVTEAQQILDLLKVQEVDEYLQDLPAEAVIVLGVESLTPEAHLVTQYDQAVAQGRELAELRQIPPSDRTPQQQQRLATLVADQQSQVADFNTFIASTEVQALIRELDQTSQRQNLDLRSLNSLQDDLRRLDRAVLLYPLVLPDRLELVLVTPDAPPLRRTVAVSAAELEQAIAAFRQALVTPRSDVRPLAQTLYTWLIAPFAAELEQGQVQTLLYAPDGQLRYIPLAALYDGQQWLVEQFQITNITAASLTDFDTPAPAPYRALAAAFSEGQYQLQVGTRQISLGGLPFAGVEVATLTALFPGSTQLLNQGFNPATTLPQMDDYPIVHLATHAEFLPGTPEASFILFGNGDRVTLRDVSAWSLPNVNLVVLSACQTAVGGELGTGEEILGFGYQLQRAGVESAIASLWSVDDGGTQALMTAFYQALSTGQPKAAAMRQAQIALIQNDQGIRDQTQRGLAVVPTGGSDRGYVLPTSLSHPYYWAPFILIGNGL